VAAHADLLIGCTGILLDPIPARHASTHHDTTVVTPPSAALVQALQVTASQPAGDSLL
jgi:hypothetical protein